MYHICLQGRRHLNSFNFAGFERKIAPKNRILALGELAAINRQEVLAQYLLLSAVWDELFEFPFLLADKVDSLFVAKLSLALAAKFANPVFS